MTMNKLISLLAAFVFSLSAFAGMSNSIEYTRVNIVGPAVKGGWDYNATPMSKIGYGVFTWTGTLKGGEQFKFMNSNDGWNKHIVATSKDEILKEGEIHHLDFYANKALPDMLDNKFIVLETGEYNLTVDLMSMSVCLKKAGAAVDYPQKYYATGSALDDKVIELTRIGDFEFKQALTCKAGNVILMDTPVRGGNTRYFIPVFEDVDLSFGKGYSSTLGVTSDSDTRGWSVTVPGDYMIYISCAGHNYSGRKYQPRKYLYIVGGCCEVSWNYDDGSNNCFFPNPEKPDELVWEGELRIGWKGNTEPDRFKILTEKSWTDETYHPYIGDTDAEGTTYIRTTDGGDTKWRITRDGYYRITANTRTETLTTEYLSSTPPDMSCETLGTAGVESADNDGVWLVCGNSCVELLLSPEPLDVRVYDYSGMTVEKRNNITVGVVADGLSEGIYLVSLRGKTINQTYKVKI